MQGHTGDVACVCTICILFHGFFVLLSFHLCPQRLMHVYEMVGRGT